MSFKPHKDWIRGVIKNWEDSDQEEVDIAIAVAEILDFLKQWAES